MTQPTKDLLRLKVDENGRFYITTPDGQEIQGLEYMSISQDDEFLKMRGLARINVDVLVEIKTRENELDITFADDETGEGNVLSKFVKKEAEKAAEKSEGDKVLNPNPEKPVMPRSKRKASQKDE